MDMFSNNAAIAPFFTDRVAIEAQRGTEKITGTFAACLMPLLNDEPIIDMVAESNRKKMVILVPKGGKDGWNHSTPIKIGDRMTIESGVTFAVYNVNEFVTDHYECEVKQCW